MGQLEDLRAFVQIVEQESIGKAADSIGVAKSAMSRRLKTLEERLGTELIVRTTRQWSLTEAGRLFYERAAGIVTEVNETEAEIRNQRSTLSGEIRLSVPLQFGSIVLSAALIDFTEAYPDIHFIVDFTDRFVNLVEENYHLAIRISELRDSTLISRKLANVSRIICASPQYLTENPTIALPADLKDHKILQFGNAKRPKWTMTSPDSKEVSVALKAHMNSDNGEFLLTAAKRGKGVFRGPDFLFRQALDEEDLVQVLPDYQRKPLGVYALYPETKFLPRRVRVFIDFLVLHCTDK
jgi:DNA-binding transcriptional LysR family regulator